jgi:uncharacterized protein YejL (UPF0352 family)
MIAIGFCIHYLITKPQNHEENEKIIFYTQVSIWMIFHFCVMFMLPYVITSNLVLSAFFVLAVGYHFFLDQHYFQEKFAYLNRSLVSIALMAGWITGLLTIHIPMPLTMMFIGSFVGGVLLMSVNKTQSHTLAFSSSLILSSGLILFILWIGIRV